MRNGEEVLRALRACARLRDAPDALLEQAGRAATVRRLARGDAVYRQGDPGRSMYVVDAGQVASRIRSSDGKAVDVGFAVAGDLFGYFEAFDGGPRDCDAVAVEPSRVVTVPHPVSLEVLTSSPAMLGAVVDDLLAIVRQQNRATSGRHFATVQERLADLLLDLAGPDGDVLLDGPQQLLAHRLGVARQSLNRTLRALAAAGLVEVGTGGRVITLLDVARLRALAGRRG